MDSNNNLKYNITNEHSAHRLNIENKCTFMKQDCYRMAQNKKTKKISKTRFLYI